MSPTVDVRDQIVSWGKYCVANQPDFLYEEERPFPLFEPTAARHIADDCSATVTLCYFLAGALDPNGPEYHYNGEGYTGSLLSNGTEIPKDSVEPGDVIVYGPGTGVHCALIIAGGADPLTMSHGWSGEPAFVHVSEGAPSGTDGVERYLRFSTTKVVPLPPPAPASKTADQFAAKNGMVEIDLAEAKLCVEHKPQVAYYTWNGKGMTGHSGAKIPTGVDLFAFAATLNRNGIPHAGVSVDWGAIEAISAAIGGTGGCIAAAEVIWHPITRRLERKRNQRNADDLFLHGAPAVPGIPAISPAGDRLLIVESGVKEANRKLDEIGPVVTELARQLRPSNGKTVATLVEETAASVSPSSGHA